MKIRANVVSKDWTDLHELWLLEEREGHELHNLNQALDGTLKRTKINEGESQNGMEPFIRMRGVFAREAFPAIVEALSKSGFERPSESMLSGKCDAMTLHLQDLRTMLHLKPRDGK